MALEVDRLELGPIGTNTYVVRSSAAATDAVVVDPSGEAATIEEALARRSARCAAILVTHGHFDHIVSLADLAEATGAPVYAPAGERVLIEDPVGRKMIYVGMGMIAVGGMLIRKIVKIKV